MRKGPDCDWDKRKILNLKEYDEKILRTVKKIGMFAVMETFQKSLGFSSLHWLLDTLLEVPLKGKMFVKILTLVI